MVFQQNYRLFYLSGALGHGDAVDISSLAAELVDGYFLSYIFTRILKIGSYVSIRPWISPLLFLVSKDSVTCLKKHSLSVI